MFIVGTLCIIGGLIIGVINGHADYNAYTNTHTVLTWILVSLGFVIALIGFALEIRFFDKKIL